MDNQLRFADGTFHADEAADAAVTVTVRKGDVMGMQQHFVMDEGTASLVSNSRSTYFMNYQFIPDDAAGGWLVDSGAVTFYASYVYDGTQEGPASSILGSYYPGHGNGPDVNSLLQIHIAFASASPVDDTVLGSWANRCPGPRQSGMKVYYSYGNPIDPDGDAVGDPGVYLLFELDHEKGIRISGDDTWREMRKNGDIFHSFLDPPELEDFLTENGYRPGQKTTASFATALFAKNRTWAGNIQIGGKNYPDRIIKSPVGKPDIFPEENFIDITGADGDEIVHMEFNADELIVFKKRSMYVVDISEMDEEKLKSTHPGMGITSYQHACVTPHGVAFANPGGIFLYTDSEVENLLIEEGVDKISNETWKLETNWNTDIWDNGKLDMEYSLDNDKLLVLMNIIPGQDQAGDIFSYHFQNKSWTKGRDVMPQSFTNSKYYCTNLIKDYQNRLLVGAIDHDDTLSGIPVPSYYITPQTRTLFNMKFFQWDEALRGSKASIPRNTLKWTSRDMDFGGVGSKKSITKVYVTYKIAGFANSFIKVQYSVDGNPNIKYEFDTISTFDDKLGEENAYDVVSGLKCTNSIFRTVELIPADRAQAKKLNSFQLHLSNPNGITTKENLNFDDFTIIYKEHTTK